MTRYQKIVRTVFPNGEIKIDIELFKSIINDLTLMINILFKCLEI